MTSETKTVEIAPQIIEEEVYKSNIIQDVNQSARDVGESMKGSLDSIQGMIGDIPMRISRNSKNNCKLYFFKFI